MAEPHLLAQGAEGRLFSSTLLGQPVIIKERFPKKYRHPVLDAKLTDNRYFQEARNMLKARKQGVPVPAILFLDPLEHKIYMERIEPGMTVKALLQRYPALPPAVEEDLAEKIASNIAKMHAVKLIHGDLTTSNMLVKPDSPLPLSMSHSEPIYPLGKVYIIDFGLSFQSGLPEDKAVDLYVLERAIVSMHPAAGRLFELIIAAYQREAEQGKEVGMKLNQVRMRGRKRLAFG